MNRKCRPVTVKEAAALLCASDRILILSHTKPDGDTLGSGFAMLYALRAIGKTVRISCSDGFPARFHFLYENADLQNQPVFEPAFVLAVDIASPKLLGENNAFYQDKIDLCIDHHPSNDRYTTHLLLEDQAAATAEIIFRLVQEMGVEIDRQIAACIYTGIATDTGCFRYSNVTANTLRISAALIDTGFDSYTINKQMFETKSVGRMALERMALDTLEYHYDGRMAMIVITMQAAVQTGVPEEDMDGISAYPRQIEGVIAGVTLRQKAENHYRISLRTGVEIDAAAVCAKFGGGGHARAAGCSFEAPLETVRARLIGAIGTALGCSPETGGVDAGV